MGTYSVSRLVAGVHDVKAKKAIGFPGRSGVRKRKKLPGCRGPDWRSNFLEKSAFWIFAAGFIF